MSNHPIVDAKEKVVAALAMVACCGLAMVLATGVVAVTSGVVLRSVAVLVAAGCFLSVVLWSHRRRPGAEPPAPNGGGPSS